MLDHEQSYNSNLLSEQTGFQNIGGNIAFKGLPATRDPASRASSNRHNYAKQT